MKNWVRISLPKWVCKGSSRISEDASFVIRRTNREIYVVTDGHGARGKNSDKCVFAKNAATWMARAIDHDPCTNRLESHYDEVSSKLDERHDSEVMGAVCASVLITPEQVVIAWIGDVSVAIGGYGIEPKVVTSEHTVLHPAERQRLEPIFRQGEFGPTSTRTGYVGYDGPNASQVYLRLDKRSGGTIAITRSFGDAAYRPAMIHRPDVLTFSRSWFPEGTVLSIFSDGAIEDMKRLYGHLRLNKLSLQECREFYLYRPARYDDTEILLVQL